MSAMTDRRDTLYGRLERGYERISTAIDEGKDVTTWEDLWLNLLREYEQVCDQMVRDVEVPPATQGALFRTTRREGE